MSKVKPRQLPKSKAEVKGEALQRTLRRGRASIRESAIVLGMAWKTLQLRILDGRVQTVQLGKRVFVTLEELQRVGLVLPTYMKQQARKAITFDSNIDNGVDYDYD